MRQYWVYILANRSHRLYIGVTNDLTIRTWQHQQGEVGFTSRYRINRLVYFEAYERIVTAIEREKELKGWRRSKKIALIESVNPRWVDLSADNFAMTDPSLVGRLSSGTADPSLRSG